MNWLNYIELNCPQFGNSSVAPKLCFIHILQCIQCTANACTRFTRVKMIQKMYIIKMYDDLCCCLGFALLRHPYVLVAVPRKIWQVQPGTITYDCKDILQPTPEPTCTSYSWVTSQRYCLPWLSPSQNISPQSRRIAYTNAPHTYTNTCARNVCAPRLGASEYRIIIERECERSHHTQSTFTRTALCKIVAYTHHSWCLMLPLYIHTHYQPHGWRMFPGARAWLRYVCVCNRESASERKREIEWHGDGMHLHFTQCHPSNRREWERRVTDTRPAHRFYAKRMNYGVR